MPARIAEIFDTIQNSIGEKVANLIFALATCLSGIAYAFIYGPLYATVCCAYIPILFGVLGFFGKKVQRSTLGKLEVTEKLGGIAEESLTAIKLVTSFC